MASPSELAEDWRIAQSRFTQALKLASRQRFDAISRLDGLPW